MNNALEATMPRALAALLRAERESSQKIAVPKTPKPHILVQSWPVLQRPSQSLAAFTTAGESRRRRIATVLFREIERRGGNVMKDRWHEHDSDRFSVNLLDATINITLKERRMPS